MPDTPVSSVYNDAYIAEQFESFRRDPASVDESWRQYFRLAERLMGGSGAPAATATTAASASVTATAEPSYLRKVAGAAALVDAIRQYGHLAVSLDPLGTAPPGAAELTPEFHGITEADLSLVPAYALGFDVGTAADIVQRLRALYAGTIGFEYTHMGRRRSASGSAAPRAGRAAALPVA